MKTYAITILTHQRRTLFTPTANAERMLETLFRHRSERRYQLHAFVVMPDHLHVLLTPPLEGTLGTCVQAIKGGFSHAIRNQFKGEVWHSGYHEHRIRDNDDFNNQKTYIANNPIRRHLPNYPYVHTQHPDQINPIPPHLLS